MATKTQLGCDYTSLCMSGVPTDVVYFLNPNLMVSFLFELLLLIHCSQELNSSNE
jgi:hypothetical protein